MEENKLFPIKFKKIEPEEFINKLHEGVAEVLNYYMQNPPPPPTFDIKYEKLTLKESEDEL